MTTDQRRAVFLILAAPFFLNDFPLIALSGTYNVYLIDYGTRAMVLMACVFWPVARTMVREPLKPHWGVAVAILCLIALPVLGRLTFIFVEIPFVRSTDLHGLFNFQFITDPTLYWLDLTFGLLAVAVTEELIFRKLALRWLEETGRTPVQIVLISALFFSLIHWGSGPGRLIYTFVIGIAYMIVYMRLRRLWPVVTAHWIEDFLAFGPLQI